MSFRLIAAGLAAATLAAAPMAASAVTLINQDSKEHTVEVRQGGASQKVTIQAGQTMQNICSAGCEIVLEVDIIVADKGDEVAVIGEGGAMYYQ